jgi:hypothetical protein
LKNTRTLPILLILVGIFLSYPAERIQARFDELDFGNVHGGMQNVNHRSGFRIQPEDKNSLVAASGCHFGIAVLNSVNGYDLSGLGVGHYLDWGHQRNNSVAGNIDYYSVVNVSDSKYPAELLALNTDLDSLKGATWIIGNEPDSEVDYQDHVSAESYAERFFEMATLIRQKDPSAKIAFGTIIQPTPVRLHYLTKAINRLAALAGSRAQALALIDIYSIHAFILNEQPLYDTQGNVISWGAGVPIGWNAAGWPAYQVVNGDQTHDIELFKVRIMAFRQWMFDLGEQTKPLWITEYGSLFPTILNVSELTTATFMEQTFDFMLGTKDSSLGQAADADRLVQKWIWYSLNEQIEKFGGSLYDPRNRSLTTVGQHFINYDPSTTAVPPLNSDVYVRTDPPLIGPSPMGPGYYQIRIRVGNLISSDRLTEVRVNLFLSGNQIGSVTLKVPRCAGTASASFHVNNLTPGNEYVFRASVTVIGGNGPDDNLANDQLTFPPITMPTFLKVNLPLVHK